MEQRRREQQHLARKQLERDILLHLWRQHEQLQQQSHQQKLLEKKIDSKEAEASELHSEKLTSFLEYDDSFFSPWNWKPNAADANERNAAISEEESLRMIFKPGSFFSYDPSGHKE